MVDSFTYGLILAHFLVNPSTCGLIFVVNPSIYVLIISSPFGETLHYSGHLMEINHPYKMDLVHLVDLINTNPFRMNPSISEPVHLWTNFCGEPIYLWTNY